MTSQETELTEAYFEHLLKHREAMVELRSDQLTTLDKSILSVSSGALGISIVFMDKIGGGSAGISGYLLASWVCFGAAISANITSYFTGSADAQREIDKLDNCVINSTPYQSGGNLFRGATRLLNVAALVLFIFGVISLAVHAYTSTRTAFNGTTTNSQARTTGNPQPPAATSRP
ncbi:hypothetical protein [Mesorhizobium sp. WSM3876]|uniref:hypothetical protein n=1 Tax=Mesorhizobium sp. WSM3876 TaxID=422277 RepID=UPI000BAFCED8|nr:hypothetical protein [Mesorhizobium sp. WSM3876]PBB88396.1 hypothetical protein CK216_01275 [Mesorhizobium sp. WSM3876]